MQLINLSFPPSFAYGNCHSLHKKVSLKPPRCYESDACFCYSSGYSRFTGFCLPCRSAVCPHIFPTDFLTIRRFLQVGTPPSSCAGARWFTLHRKSRVAPVVPPPGCSRSVPSRHAGNKPAVSRLCSGIILPCLHSPVFKFRFLSPLLKGTLVFISHPTGGKADVGLETTQAFSGCPPGIHPSMQPFPKESPNYQMTSPFFTTPCKTLIAQLRCGQFSGRPAHRPISQPQMPLFRQHPLSTGPDSHRCSAAVRHRLRPVFF